MFQRTVSFWRRLVGAAPVLTDDARTTPERRQSVRYDTDQQVAYRAAALASTAPSRSAQLHDVSAGGISLVTDEEYKPGDLLSVQLPGGADEKPTSVLACVVHVGKRPQNRWSLGCTFASELSALHLGLFGLTDSTTAATADQRSHPRHPVSLEATYQLVAEEREENWPARVLNISTSGVGLAVQQPIEVGKLLNVELNASGRDDGPSLLCCAVHVTEQAAGEWLIGCNFITEMPESEFDSLLRG